MTRMILNGSLIAVSLSGAVAPASAQSVYGPGYAYGPPPGSAYGYVPYGYAYGHPRRRGPGGAYHGNVPGNCAVDLGYGRWQSCDTLGPR